MNTQIVTMKGASALRLTPAKRRTGTGVKRVIWLLAVVTIVASVSGTATAQLFPRVTICSPTGGSVSPSPGTHTYVYGQTVSIRATAASTYRFSYWGYSGGVSVADRYDPTTTMRVTGDGRLCAWFARITYTVSICTPTGGSVSPSPGSHTYVTGTSVSIRATPASGYRFVRWSYSGVTITSPTSASTTMRVTANGSVCPIFERTSARVTVCTPSGGTVSPSPGTHTYTPGSTVSIRATPASGCTFSFWIFTGGVSVTSSTSASTTMRVTGDGTLCPVFSCIGTGRVTVCTPSGGTVSPSPGIHTYAAGSTVSIRAYPSSGCSFVRWSYSGGVSVTSSTSAYTTMRVTGDGTLCPVFSCPPGTVTICTPSGGTVSPSPGTHTYALGSVVPITATPASGRNFIRWNATGGVSVANATDPTTTMRVNGSGTLCPQFTGSPPPPANEYTVEILEPTNGTVSLTPGSYTRPEGTVMTIFATPNQGCRLARWECSGVSVSYPAPGWISIKWDNSGTVLAVFDCGVIDGDTCPPGALLAHWKLDERTGRVAHDSAGTCDGVLIGGPVWQPIGGKVDGALRFDGSNDCVVTDIVLDPVDGPFSVFAWVKGGGPNQVIVSQDGAAGGADWLAVNSAGRLMTALGGRSLISSKVIVDNQWHEVGLTWDGRSRALYVDKAVAAEDEPPGPTSSPGGMNIGTGKNFDAGTYWSGLIDDVRICNQAVRPRP